MGKLIYEDNSGLAKSQPIDNSKTRQAEQENIKNRFEPLLKGFELGEQYVKNEQESAERQYKLDIVNGLNDLYDKEYKATPNSLNKFKKATGQALDQFVNGIEGGEQFKMLAKEQARTMKDSYERRVWDNEAKNTDRNMELGIELYRQSVTEPAINKQKSIFDGTASDREKISLLNDYAIQTKNLQKSKSVSTGTYLYTAEQVKGKMENFYNDVIITGGKKHFEDLMQTNPEAFNNSYNNWAANEDKIKKEYDLTSHQYDAIMQTAGVYYRAVNKTTEKKEGEYSRYVKDGGTGSKEDFEKMQVEVYIDYETRMEQMDIQNNKNEKTGKHALEVKNEKYNNVESINEEINFIRNGVMLGYLTGKEPLKDIAKLDTILLDMINKDDNSNIRESSKRGSFNNAKKQEFAKIDARDDWDDNKKQLQKDLVEQDFNEQSTYFGMSQTKSAIELLKDGAKNPQYKQGETHIELADEMRVGAFKDTMNDMQLQRISYDSLDTTDKAKVVALYNENLRKQLLIKYPKLAGSDKNIDAVLLPNNKMVFTANQNNQKQEKNKYITTPTLKIGNNNYKIMVDRNTGTRYQVNINDPNDILEETDLTYY
ncbi:MAG: hypothetical protein LBI80_05445 [Endomicrobium sp.]|jgi:hypothetical protein|nr:hypothetical protein [Endomicrobium sp.]